LCVLKKIGLTIFWGALINVTGFDQLHASQMKAIKLLISGYETTEGILQVSLESSEKQYYGDEKPYRTVSIRPAKVGNHTEIIIEKISSPLIAVKVFHDVDEDAELDLHLFGFPTEAYGISNNVRAMFGLPDFSDAVVQLSEPTTDIPIGVSPHIGFL
jgi:uncharacterized protein (DUF2141 family)